MWFGAPHAWLALGELTCFEVGVVNCSNQGEDLPDL
jgi:hypothetical protein